MEQHHNHPTDLVKIEGFDIVRDIPLDYMHLTLIGCCQRLVQLWVNAGPYKMKPATIEKVSVLLEKAKNYTPAEFQRKPEKLHFIATWKATQWRLFLLYIGSVVLQGNLKEEFYDNFNLLVYCMRYLTKHVPNSEFRDQILQNIGERMKLPLRYFLKQAISLYTGNIAVYKMHNLIHMPDDYKRFGPLDEYSAFKYESFFGLLKKMVTGSCEPLVQVSNKWSSLLLTESYGTNGDDRKRDVVEEFYESPDLRHILGDNDEQFLNFKLMKFRNFVIRTDNIKDRHCCMRNAKNENEFIKVTKISKCKNTNEIYIFGQRYETCTDLFYIPQLNFSSSSVGMNLAARRTLCSFKYCLNQLKEKCFAVPLNYPPACVDPEDQQALWAIITYLH